MITEDEATRLLKRADPARVDDSAPFVDAAGYLAALRTRSTTVTLIDTEPTPTRRPSRHHWPIIAVAAAAVVAVVVGGLVLATRDDDPNEQIPAATTVATDPDVSAAEAEEVARGFVDAYVAADADRALSYLTDDVIASGWGSANEFRGLLAWKEAAGYKEIFNDCERRADTEAGTVVRCGFDLHGFGSETIGLGPYDGGNWDLTVREGKIVAEEHDDGGNDFSDEVWAPFATWIRTEHPDDVLVMYRDGSQQSSRNDDESLRLWEQRTQEYVQAVLTGRETYAEDVRAICATLAARLGELTEPAQGALDQVAAWNTDLATIVEQAHGDLTALDKPPRADTMAHPSFYGRLLRLVRIAEDSAAAATAGDSTRLAELNAEYLEVRQSMSSGPAGSGLEECLASLPS